MLDHLSRAFLVAMCCVSWTFAHAGIPVTLDGGELPSLAPLVDRVKPAVVSVITSRAPLDPPEQNRPAQPEALGSVSASNVGSGVIVDARKGLVVTSHANVAGATALTVLLLDGRLLDAELLGSDAVTDLALLRIEPDALTTLPMADSNKLRIGDFVMAIGNPFGVGKSVTLGIVSGLGRAATATGAYADHIQTDASINPGSSGGVLVNLRGELVGVTTGLFGPIPLNVGIGFAVPSNTVVSVVGQLLEHGEIRRARLGVTTQDVTADMVAALSLRVTRGALVVNVVPGTAAERAGLRRGDVVVAVDGDPVRGSAQMRAQVGLVRLGSVVTLSILRDSQFISLAVKLTDPLKKPGETDPLQPRQGAREFES